MLRFLLLFLFLLTIGALAQDRVATNVLFVSTDHTAWRQPELNNFLISPAAKN